jgi:hypothetical protein
LEVQMTERSAARPTGARTRRRVLSLVAALMLAGCAESETSGAGSGTSVPAGADYAVSDPYHYHCTGRCLEGF